MSSIIPSIDGDTGGDHNDDKCRLADIPCAPYRYGWIHLLVRLPDMVAVRMSISTLRAPTSTRTLHRAGGFLCAWIHSRLVTWPARSGGVQYIYRQAHISNLSTRGYQEKNWQRRTHTAT